MSLEINQQDLEDIDEALLDEELPNKFRRKLLALKMRNVGAPLEMISAILKVTVRSVSNYVAEYREGGLEASLEDRAYAPMSSAEPHMEAIEESFRKSPVGSSRQARRRIFAITKIEFSLSQTRRIMRRLGMRYRKAGQIPGKANPDEQLEFLDKKLQPRLQEAREGKRKVFFVDAAHFVMGAVAGMLWCFHRVFVRGASGRQFQEFIAAIDTKIDEANTKINDEMRSLLSLNFQVLTSDSNRIL